MVNSKELKPRLLITEDDVENQKFLQFFLKRYFYVETCDSSDTFYEKINKNMYDVILMDISIKGNKNGLELTRELKSNPNLSKILVVCYTAHAFNKDRINALDAGCDAYISKPTDVYSLLNSLISLLQTKGIQLLRNSSSLGFATS